MFYTVVAILAMASLTIASPGGYGGGGGYGSAPIPYSFGYNVEGDSGPSFGHNEKSGGHGAVAGSYTVALPDGRRQTVQYTADHQTGFVAKVTYSGTAQHPAYYGPAITFPQNGGGGGGGYH